MFADVILQAFSSLTSGHNYTKADLHDFVQRYFDGPGAEFEKWTPTDSVEKLVKLYLLVHPLNQNCIQRPLRMNQHVLKNTYICKFSIKFH